ncbi:MAG: COX15/CtaA family protein [Anaerolineae bacterium]|nr:COX15/CtaA family protein [Anaerolineae bacterium]MDX9833170.1 COX15/CtaA family protein [Anaerolineae bacterium]
MTNRHRNLFLAASLFTYLLVTLGGVVCVTDASRGCPDWPACYGQLVPPPRFDSILEYTHRVVAALTSLLIVASAIVGWRRYRANRWLWQPLAIAIGFLLVVILLGALVVLRGLEPGLAALDLGSALMVQALVTTAAVVAASRGRSPRRPSLAGGLARLALWALVATWIVLVSGVLVAESGSAVRCLSWPLYGGEANPAVGQAREWLGWARRVVGALAGILILAVVVQAWRAQGWQRGPRPVAAALGLVLVIEIVVGGVLAGGSGTLALQVVYVALAAALWPLLVALWVMAGLREPAASS